MSLLNQTNLAFLLIVQGNELSIRPVAVEAVSGQWKPEEMAYLRLLRLTDRA